MRAARAQVRAWSQLESASPVPTPAMMATTSMNSTPRGTLMTIMLSGYFSCQSAAVHTFSVCKLSTPHSDMCLWVFFTFVFLCTGTFAAIVGTASSDRLNAN